MSCPIADPGFDDRAAPAGIYQSDRHAIQLFVQVTAEIVSDGRVLGDCFRRANRPARIRDVLEWFH